MKRIVILQDIPQYHTYLKSIAPDWEIIFTKDRQSARCCYDGAEIIVGWSREAGKACLTEGTSLKWVQAWSAGVDTMPQELFAQHNIQLTTTSGVHARPIAETFFAMMLSQARALPKARSFQKEGVWAQGEFSLADISEMHGKTLGILGAGKIGAEIARLARAFYMKTLGLRRSVEATPHLDKIYQSSSVTELLAQCDYVVNILPLTSKTAHIMGEAEFASMKPTARYYNLGRGATTDTNALIEALEKGIIAGAGLDVMETEPLPTESPLWSMENVIITPHISGMTPYYSDRAIDIFSVNLADYIAGRPLSRNLVNYDSSY